MEAAAKNEEMDVEAEIQIITEKVLKKKVRLKKKKRKKKAKKSSLINS